MIVGKGRVLRSLLNPDTKATFKIKFNKCIYLFKCV